MVLRAAAVSWRMAADAQGASFEERLCERVGHAVALGAQCVVLPELLVLDLLGASPEVDEPDVPKHLAPYADRFVACLQSLARAHEVTVVGGSHFEDQGRGIENVCAVATPTGLSRHAKNRLTAYERDVWGLVPGLGVAPSTAPEIGVLVCYDSEFPEAGRLVAEEACRVLCVPAFTETTHGFHRVRYAAHARAVENQIFAIHASLVGTLGREPVPSAVGTSALIAPSHSPFPANGVLAESCEGGIALADLDFSALERCRSDGDVRNWNDRHEPWFRASSGHADP